MKQEGQADKNLQR